MRALMTFSVAGAVVFTVGLAFGGAAYAVVSGLYVVALIGAAVKSEK